MLIKHKILKHLNEVYQDKSHTTSNTTELGKSESAAAIQRKLNVNLDKLNTVLPALEVEGYVTKGKIHGKGDISFWRITPLGQKALTDKEFHWLPSPANLTQFLTLIVKFLTFILALFGTLNSIFDWVKIN